MACLPLPPHWAAFASKVVALGGEHRGQVGLASSPEQAASPGLCPAHLPLPSILSLGHLRGWFLGSSAWGAEQSWGHRNHCLEIS